jgi:hypothetical protein
MARPFLTALLVASGILSLQATPGAVSGEVSTTGAATIRQETRDAPSSETVYRMSDNGIRCIAAPCFSYDVQVVNVGERSTVSNVDLSRVEATPEQRVAATEAIVNGSLLVAGTIQAQPGAGPAGDGRVLVASQIYLPVAAPNARMRESPPGEQLERR